MATPADDIAVFLAAVGLAQGPWAIGTNIFIDVLPETPDFCMSLKQYAGRGPQQVYGGRVAYEYPRLQVRCRGHNRSSQTGGYTEAMTLSNDVLKALVAISNQTLSGVYYLSVNPLSSPVLLNRDANDRPVFVCNYEITKVLS
jgi:hypothetical protein